MPLSWQRKPFKASEMAVSVCPVRSSSSDVPPRVFGDWLLFCFNGRYPPRPHGACMGAAIAFCEEKSVSGMAFVQQ